MVCPYACNTRQVTQTRSEYAECDGTPLETFRETVLTEDRYYPECAKEDCGAWRGGACHYKEYC